MRKQIKRHKIDEINHSSNTVVEQVLGIQPWSISQSNLEKRIQQVTEFQAYLPSENFTQFLPEVEVKLYQKILSLLHVSIGFSASEWHRAKTQNQILPATPPLITREQFYLQNLQHLTWSVGSAKQKPSKVAGRDRYTILRLPLHDSKTSHALKGAWLSPNLLHVANQQECGQIRFANSHCHYSYRQLEYCGSYQIGEKISSNIKSTYKLNQPDSQKATYVAQLRHQRFEDQVVSIEHLSPFLALTIILELRYIGGHYQQEIFRNLDNEKLICELIDIILNDDYYQLHSPGIFSLEPIFEIAEISCVDFRIESFLYGLTKEALGQFHSLCNEFNYGFDFNKQIIKRALTEDNAYFIKRLFKLGLPTNIFMSKKRKNAYMSLLYYATSKKAIKTITLIASTNTSYFLNDFQRAAGEFLCDLIEYKILDEVITTGLGSPKLSNIEFDLRYNFYNAEGYHPLMKSVQTDCYAFESILSRTQITPQLGGLVVCEVLLNFSANHSSVPQLVTNLEKLFLLGADANTHYWLPIKQSKIDILGHEHLGFTPLYMALEALNIKNANLKAIVDLLIRNKADPYKTAQFQIHDGVLGNPFTLWSLAEEWQEGDLFLEETLGLPKPEHVPQELLPSKCLVHLTVRLTTAESCRFFMVPCHEPHLAVNQELQLPNAYFGVMDQNSTRNTVKWLCLKYHLHALYAELSQQRLTLREITSINDNFSRDVFYLIDIATPQLAQTTLQSFYSLNELMDQRSFRVADQQIKLLSQLQYPNSNPDIIEMDECTDDLSGIEILLRQYENSYPLYSTELYRKLKRAESTIKFQSLILHYQHLSRILSKHALTKLLEYCDFSKNRSQIRPYLTLLGLDETAYFLMDNLGYHQRVLFNHAKTLEYYYYPELERMLTYLCYKLQLAKEKGLTIDIPKFMPLLSNQLKMLHSQIIHSTLANDTKINLLSMIIEILYYNNFFADEDCLIAQILSKMQQIVTHQSLTADPNLISLQQALQLTKQLKTSKLTSNISISTLARAHFINTEKPSMKRPTPDDDTERHFNASK